MLPRAQTLPASAWASSIDGGSAPITADVRAAFRRYDANRSGHIDYRELRAALKELGIRVDERDATRVLQEYDANGLRSRWRKQGPSNRHYQAGP